MKIGVLYPRSKAHPEMMPDFADGIKSALNHFQLNQEVELISESIGFGGNEKEVYEKAEKLLILETVDILLAYIDQRVIFVLEPLLNASRKLMIVVNPGANYPENRMTQSNIIYLTLQQSFLCWMTGSMAANNQNKNAVLATTFYDAGYLHVAAFTKSYINNKGIIIHNYVNNSLYNETFEISPLTDFLSSEKDAENIICVFDIKPASLFYDRLNKYSAAGKLHLFVSPMMLEKKSWEGKRLHFSLEGYIPYQSTFESKSNIEFRNIFLSHTKREATVFAMQGWESVLIINEVFNNCKDKYQDGGFIKDHLAKIVFESPRGNLKMDKETHYFTAPVYKATVKNNSDEILITPVNDIAEEWERFVSNPVEGPSSGWTNTYLCY